MRINSVHNGPVHVASVGHHRVAITAPSIEPVAIAQPRPPEARGHARRRAKAAVAQRKDEVARGAGFLERLTTLQRKPGPG